MPCEVVHLRVDFFQNGCRCHGNGKNAKKMKNTNDHSRLLAKQNLIIMLVKYVSIDCIPQAFLSFGLLTQSSSQFMTISGI